MRLPGRDRLVNCNNYIAFAVHGSRASPRTACALTVHPELVEGFLNLDGINCYTTSSTLFGDGTLICWLFGP